MKRSFMDKPENIDILFLVGVCTRLWMKFMYCKQEKETKHKTSFSNYIEVGFFFFQFIVIRNQIETAHIYNFGSFVNFFKE